MTMIYVQLSPGRLDALKKLRERFDLPGEEIREAMSLRNHILPFAEEYLRNKNSDIPEEEKYPLWNSYISMVSASRAGEFL